MDWDSEIHDEFLVLGQAARNEDLLMRTAEENVAFFVEFRPGHFVHVRLGEEDIWFPQAAHSPTGLWNSFVEKFLKVYERHGFILLHGSHTLRRGTPCGR